MPLKVKVTSNSAGPVEVAGLGLIDPNTWVEVTAEQEATFEARNGRPLSEAHQKGGFEVKSVSTKTTKTDPAPVVEPEPEPQGGEE